MFMMDKLKRCDNCTGKFICSVKESFENSLKKSLAVLDANSYVDLCNDVLIAVGNKCKLFRIDDEDFYGN